MKIILTFVALYSAALCHVVKFSPRDAKIQRDLVVESDKNSANNSMEDLLEYNRSLMLARLINGERDLANDLNDIMSLIDVQALMSIALKYMEDPDVKQLVSFLLSQEFKEMILEFEAIPEFKEALSFLTAKGYDLTPTLNTLHQLLSLPPFHSRGQRSGGVSALIDSIAQALPIADLKAKFQEKLKSSPELAGLYEAVTSEQLEEILDRMTYNDTFVKVKSRLQVLGFDFELIRKVFEPIFESQ